MGTLNTKKIPLQIATVPAETRVRQILQNKQTPMHEQLIHNKVATLCTYLRS